MRGARAPLQPQSQSGYTAIGGKNASASTFLRCNRVFSHCAKDRRQDARARASARSVLFLSMFVLTEQRLLELVGKRGLLGGFLLPANGENRLPRNAQIAEN